MYCRRCQYNLVQLTRPSCPECGTAFDPADPGTYLSQPRRGLPLLGTRLSDVVWHWSLRQPTAALFAWLVVQLGIRTAGTAFIAMIPLIALVEGASGRNRTHYVNVIVINVIILIGFYITHALGPLLQPAGRRGPLQWWAYGLGLLIAALIFVSPLRP